MEAVVLFGAVFWAVGSVLSAPSDQYSACMSITKADADSMATCCNYAIPFTNKTMEKCKTKEASGELHKEYECIPDCLFINDDVLTDKKFDHEKWKRNVDRTVPNDWKNLIADSPNHCSEFEKILGSQVPKQCPSTESDSVFNCMTLQWYLRCPESAKIPSKSCKQSREKFTKCYEFVFPA